MELFRSFRRKEIDVLFHYLCLVIRPKRHCETATPGSSPGPNENAKEALSQRHSGRESPFRGGGGPVVDWRPKKKERIRAPFANAKIRYFKADCKSAMKKHYGVMVCRRCGLRLIRCSLQVFHRMATPFRVFHKAETESLVEPFGLWIALVHKQSGGRKAQPGRFLAGGSEQG